MFDLVKRTIEINGKEEVIERFAVWFQTPLGLISDLDCAISKLKENDFDPSLMIVPVTVAIELEGLRGHELIIQSRIG